MVSSAKAVIDNMEMDGHNCVSIKLYVQKQTADWIWPVVCSLQTTGVSHVGSRWHIARDQ